MIERFVLTALLCGGVAAQAQEVSDCHPEGVAFGGLDVTTYFDAEGVRAGSGAVTHEREGLTYRFETEANRDRFAADPEQFLPTYRGWCATTLSFGRLACPDFDNYLVEDGQLLLFETTAFTNGRTVWLEDPDAHQARADVNYRTLLETP